MPNPERRAFVADTVRFNELFDLPDRVGMAEGIRRMVSLEVSA